MTNPLLGDGEFLLWLKDRLTCVYKESPDADFVKRLERIAVKHMAVDKIAAMIDSAGEVARKTNA